MTTQPAHDRLSEAPWWTVQTVFDPDGGGADFAYTIGCHDRGLPELHIWARPDRGHDPGEDWMLSTSDRCHVLNELVRLLADGRLSVGETVTRVYDAGMATVELTVGGPGDREALEAFGIHPEAEVWAVSWSLTRPPEGPNAPLTDAAHERAAADFSAALDTVDHRFPLPAPTGWDVPVRPTFEPDQAFGPRTPVVLARAAQVWRAGVGDLNALLHAAIDVDLSGSLTFPIAMAFSAARTAGRRPALERLQRAVDELEDWLTDAPVCRARWQELLISLYGSEPREGRDSAVAHRSSARLLHDVVLSCLAVEAVADVLDDEWLLAGRGPYLAALGRPAGELAGPEWSASPPVVRAVIDALRPLSAQELGSLALLHETARTGRVTEWESYPDVFAKLHGWSLVGPAGCPWAGALDGLPAWRPLLSPYCIDGVDVVLAPFPLLQEWASCLTAAICHRARLSREEVEVFLEPPRELLPGLADLVNQPLTDAS